MTPRERDVFNVLTQEPMSPWQIAELAGIRTMSRAETASKYCISLTHKGLAVKHGSRMFPRWAKA